MALPTAAPDPANTVKPVYMWAVLTRNGTSSEFEIPCMEIQEEITVNNVKRLVPSGAWLRPDRTVPTTKEQAFVCTVDEFDATIRNLMFGSTFFEGTCTIWVTDPADAANYVKLRTNDFACSVLPATGLNLSREAFAQYAFRIETEEDVAITADVDHTA